MAFTLQSIAGIMHHTVFIQSVCSSICEQKHPQAMQDDSASLVSCSGDMVHADNAPRMLAALCHTAHAPWDYFHTCVMVYWSSCRDC